MKNFKMDNISFTSEVIEKPSVLLPQRNPPVLLLSWSVPPLISGSSIVVSNLMQNFKSDQMIVVGEACQGLESQEASKILYPIKALPKGWRGVKLWRILLTPLLAWRVRRLIKKWKCCKVITIYPDETFLFAGWWASRSLGCDFYPYLHNTYLENSTGLRKFFARWLQGKVFRDAKHVFVMSDGMVDYYKKNYPNIKSCSALRHSFTEKIPEFTPQKKIGNPLKFVMTGNINESCLDAAQRMCEAVRLEPEASLQFFSGLTKNYYQQQGLWTQNCSCACVSRSELLEGVQSADILLLPHGFSGGRAPVEYETIFPTRTIEYLISGKPILAHSPPNSFLTRFLEDRDCALVVDVADTELLSEAIDRLQNDVQLRARLVKNALITARMFQSTEVIRHLNDVIKK